MVIETNTDSGTGGLQTKLFLSPSPGRRWSVEGGEGNGGSRLGEAVPADIIRGEEEGSSRGEQEQ